MECIRQSDQDESCDRCLHDWFAGPRVCIPCLHVRLLLDNFLLLPICRTRSLGIDRLRMIGGLETAYAAPEDSFPVCGPHYCLQLPRLRTVGRTTSAPTTPCHSLTLKLTQAYSHVYRSASRSLSVCLQRVGIGEKVERGKLVAPTAIPVHSAHSCRFPVRVPGGAFPAN